MRTRHTPDAITTLLKTERVHRNRLRELASKIQAHTTVTILDKATSKKLVEALAKPNG